MKRNNSIIKLSLSFILVAQLLWRRTCLKNPRQFLLFVKMTIQVNMKYVPFPINESESPDDALVPCPRVFDGVEISCQTKVKLQDAEQTDESFLQN